MSERRRYRKFSVEQKLEVVLAGLRGERSVAEICREHDVNETLYYQWRDKLIEGGKLRLGDSLAKDEQRALKKRIAELERTLGKKTLELEIAGKALRGWE